jgi:hypothetical protein
LRFEAESKTLQDESVGDPKDLSRPPKTPKRVQQLFTLLVGDKGKAERLGDLIRVILDRQFDGVTIVDEFKLVRRVGRLLDVGKEASGIRDVIIPPTQTRTLPSISQVLNVRVDAFLSDQFNTLKVIEAAHFSSIYAQRIELIFTISSSYPSFIYHFIYYEFNLNLLYCEYIFGSFLTQFSQIVYIYLK